MPVGSVPVWYPLCVVDATLTRGEPVEIQVGQECTYGIGSDRYAYEVVAIIDARTIKVRRMHVEITEPDGLGNGTCVYLPDPTATPRFLREYRAGGKAFWGFAEPVEGSRAWSVRKSGYFMFDGAREYRDPSF